MLLDHLITKNLFPSQETPVYEDEDFPLADKRMNQMIFQPDETDVLANEELGYYDTNAKFTACDVETHRIASVLLVIRDQKL